MSSASILVSHLLALTPTPSPTPEFDETVITPGPAGFAAMAFVTIAVVLLIVDMVRRVRRVRYRAEVREEIAREQADIAAQTRIGGSAPDDDGSRRGSTPPPRADQAE